MSLARYYEFTEAEGRTVKSFKISTSGEREILLGFEDGSLLTVRLDLGFTAHPRYTGCRVRRRAVHSGPSLVPRRAI